MPESNSKEDLEYFKTGENGELIPDYDQTIQVFEEGDIISGVIVKIDRDEVLVDVGYKSEGVIPNQEFSVRARKKIQDFFSEGEKVDALVLQKEDMDGRLILSKKRADFEKAWRSIEECRRNNETIEGEVIEVVKGGLILDIGIRGFLPASLIDLHRIKDLSVYTGQNLCCKIIETDRRRNNVVLSRRAVLETSRQKERKKILDKLENGQILSGKISSIVDFGAFVDLGGIDGLIHISELSWTHVSHPSEIVEVGQDINVQVLDIDYDKERVSLGLKQTQSDPWQELSQNVKEGQIIKGCITKIVPFGAFIELGEGIEGLIHISELSVEEINDVKEAVNIGDEIESIITEIDSDRRRISLSIKKLFQEEEPEEDSEALAEETDDSSQEEKTEETEAAQSEVIEEQAEEVIEESAEKAIEEPESKATEEELIEEAPEQEADIAAQEAQPDEEPQAATAEDIEETSVEEDKEVEAKAEEASSDEDSSLPEETIEAETEEEEPVKDDQKEEKILASSLDSDEEEDIPVPGSLEDVLQDMKKKRNNKS